MSSLRVEGSIDALPSASWVFRSPLRVRFCQDGTVLGDRILYEGDLFVDASSVEELGERCAAAKR
jgi:hypothetical protein